MFDDYVVPDVHQLKVISACCTDQLKRSATGKKTSFPFIIHEIRRSSKKVHNEKFQVLVIGGSNGISAICQKINNHVEIASKQSVGIPVFDTADTFCEFILAHLDRKCTNLIINFAFPLTPVIRDGLLTGILGRGTKEHEFKGMAGKNVAEVLEAYIYTRIKRHIMITLANDTICLALSSFEKSRDTNAAAVIGTGINHAIFLNSSHVVNLESANFTGFTQSSIGKSINDRSKEKGIAIFEKEISGAYLYKHANILFEDKNIRGYINSTHHLSELARAGNDPRASIARLVLTRSAALASVMFSGITNYYQSDTTFVVEGSLFWEAYSYKDFVEQTVTQLTSHKVTFFQIPDSSILGAAHLLVP